MTRAGLAALAVRDDGARELMDDAGADPAMLDKTYARFRLVNAVVSGERAVYRRWVRPRLTSSRTTRMLDVGTGSADLPRRLLRWAEADGLRLEVTAIDPDARAIAWASAQPSPPGLILRRAMSSDLADAGERFDLVVSNHVLHHLGGHELGALLADSERLLGPGGIAVHGDIERSRLGYAGFALGTLPFAGNLLSGTYIRPDGLTSIRRSHTAAELAATLPPGWRVRRAFPSRLEVIWSADAAG
ncbi:methyltransferase domain-containing protein [Agromyces ramosus]|uniref:2-polyprenyl-3-methyl-5-hydroxy-6-metoxy-1, 4-benzoquinol methylase n=1 Tax=Agromyces ramosus TaxID=33879 RepID=A0ABU0R737_9MICO|nr:methyltransferase domain-containing protein [Agromyces ramosus]MDQ0893893.1 2-polyprenyl-3-methyl-5-hydroxy-6-metoxy-1,4-benzoquinol methylase [Agromyces ramosus]